GFLPRSLPRCHLPPPHYALPIPFPCSVACFSSAGKSAITGPLPTKCDSTHVATMAKSAIKAATMIIVSTIFMRLSPGTLAVQGQDVDLRHSEWPAQKSRTSVHGPGWSLRPLWPSERAGTEDGCGARAAAI